MRLRGAGGVAVLLVSVAGMSFGAGAAVRRTGFEIVHFCDVRGECRQSHAVLTGTGPAVAARFASRAEGAAAMTELGLIDLPATVLYRDGRPVGALSGSRRPDVLQRELGELEMAIRAGMPPVQVPVVAPEPDTGLVVVVDLRVRGGSIEILGTELIAGAAPKPTAGALDAYRVQLLDERGAPLVARDWQPVMIATAPPPLPGRPSTGPTEVVATRTAVVLPYHPDATEVRFEQPFGLEAARSAIERTPDARQARAATPIHVTGPDSERLVVLVLGDLYKSKAKRRFPTDAKTIVEYLLDVRPFADAEDDINVYRSSTVKGLGCKYQQVAGGTDSRLLVCNHTRVFKRAARDRIPYDEILVLANSEKYGGSGLRAVGGGGANSYAVSYNRIGWEPGATEFGWGPQVSVHELGHSFGGVMDEYQYGTAGDPWGPNCQMAPCNWSVKGLGCFAGCSYNGLSRPTDRGCLMHVLSPVGGYVFCPVCFNQVEDVLERY